MTEHQPKPEFVPRKRFLTASPEKYEALMQVVKGKGNDKDRILTRLTDLLMRSKYKGKGNEKDKDKDRILTRLTDLLIRSIYTGEQHTQKSETEHYKAQRQGLKDILTALGEEIKEDEFTPYELRLFISFVISTFRTQEGAMQQRNINTTSLFPSYLSAVVHDALDEYFRVHQDKKEAPLTRKDIQDFRKIYQTKLNEHYENLEKGIPETPQRLTNGKSKWLVVNEHNFQNIKEDGKPEFDSYEEAVAYMAERSRNIPASWCTGAGQKHTYTRGSNTMHILRGACKTKVKDGQYKDDEAFYVAIRVENNRIAEVRGRLANQNISSGAIEDAVAYLKELKEQGVQGCDEHINKLLNLTTWFAIEETFGIRQENETYKAKDKQAIRAKLKELFSKTNLKGEKLQEHIETLRYLFILKRPRGTGYTNIDTTVRDAALDEIREIFTEHDDQKLSNNILKIIKLYLKDDFDIPEKEKIKAKHIAIPDENGYVKFTKHTKVILGNYTYKKGKGDEKYLENITITGNAYFNSLTTARDITFPKRINGNLNLGNLENAANLKLPEYVGGNLSLSSLTTAEGLTLPEYVGGDISLYNLTIAEKVTFPEYVGGNLSLSSLTTAEGLALPEHVGGYLYLENLTTAKDLTLPKYVGGYLYFGYLTTAEGLTLPEYIGGGLYFEGLTTTEHLVLPESYTGTVYLNRVPTNEIRKLKKEYPNVTFMKNGEVVA